MQLRQVAMMVGITFASVTASADEPETMDPTICEQEFDLAGAFLDACRTNEIHLLSTDGTAIDIGGLFTRGGNGVNGWSYGNLDSVEVSGPGVRPSQQVHVVVVGGRLEPVQAVDLVWSSDEGGFVLPTGWKARYLMRRFSSHYGTVTTDIKFAISIDGVWLTDPINGTHDFVLNGAFLD